MCIYSYGGERRFKFGQYHLLIKCLSQVYKLCNSLCDFVFKKQYSILDIVSSFCLSNTQIYIKMGASSQHPYKIYLTLQRNYQIYQKELFDFTKDRETLTNTVVSYPSFVHHYEKTNEIQYSLLEDPRNNIFSLDSQNHIMHQLYLRRSQREGRASIWKVVTEHDQQELQQGDIIKIGRIELYFKEMRSINCKKTLKHVKDEFQQEVLLRPTSFMPHQKSPLKNSGHFNKFQMSRVRQSHDINMMNNSIMNRSDFFMVQSGVSHRSVAQKACRICFDGNSTSNNPLFNVCMCSGTVKYVHFQCLRNWFRSKTVKFQTPNCIYYSYQPMQCEICKYAISNEVLYHGNKYNLFEYQKIYPPYAKFQHYSDNKIFQIQIRLEEQLNIMIGRGSENDLNLSDSSISRSHCSLFYTSNKLFLKGMPTKYGTFVQFNKNIDLQPGKGLQLVISNHLVTLSRKDQGGIFKANCCSNTVSPVIIVQ